MSEKPAWTAQALEQALRARFAPPEYAFLSEVRSGTGGNYSRTCDGLAMSVWPSRGLLLLGFEIKVSRHDWLRELREPAKAEKFFRYCDRWYLVVADEQIVQPGELPATWGLMAPRGRRLVVKVEAPSLQPEPPGRVFLAALMRHLNEATPAEAAIQEALARGRKEGREAAEKRGPGQDWGLYQAKAEAERFRRAFAEFEAASGVKIDHYDGRRIGEAVRWALGGGMDRAQQEYKRLIESANALARFCASIEDPRTVREPGDA